MTRIFTALETKTRKEKEIAFSTECRSVAINGVPCELTLQEYLLLFELANHAGRLLTRDALLMSAWGFVSPGKTRTVDVHVQRLRRKLGPSVIQTVHGKGYKMCAQAVGMAT